MTEGSARPRVCVVLPALNAASTVVETIGIVPRDVVDHIILVDDGSDDDTCALARQQPGVTVIAHEETRGYGGNQKTCYEAALATDAQIVVMVHPDGQHDPRIIPYVIGPIQAGVVDAVIGNRILRRKDALGGGMPVLKYFSNRVLTIIENVVLGYNLPEYHCGYRAFHRRVLERVDFMSCSDNFVFDQEILVQARVHDFRVGSVPVTTRYDDLSSSISVARASWYAGGTIGAMARFLLYRLGFKGQRLFRTRPDSQRSD